MERRRDPPMAPSVEPLYSKWRSGSNSSTSIAGMNPVFYGRWLGVERLSVTGSRCTLKRACFSQTPPTFSLRKEVIQPQVLLRLPCYDFTPIMNHTLGRCLPCGLARRLLVQSTFVM